MSHVDPFHSQWNALSKAIVEQAVVDYRASLEFLKANKNEDTVKMKPNDRKRFEEKLSFYKRLKKDCIEFFRGNWIKELTDIDGRKIKQIIEEQVRAGIHVVKMQRGGDGDD